MPTKYEGNCPGVVNNDAKYHVKQSRGKYVVELPFRTAQGEKWYMTTTQHDDLVEKVNAVKTATNGTLGGVFYINEYRQVLVPAGTPPEYYYAGDYHQDLEFDFEGHRISGKPCDLEGGPLAPGCVWAGPHVGIPYKLNAGGRDISYEKAVRPNVTREERLSAYVGPEKAAQVAAKIAAIAGFAGGRFYINEYRQLFKPRGNPVEYIYVGALGPDDPWFPRPHSGHP